MERRLRMGKSREIYTVVMTSSLLIGMGIRWEDEMSLRNRHRRERTKMLPGRFWRLVCYKMGKEPRWSLGLDVVGMEVCNDGDSLEIIVVEVGFGSGLISGSASKVRIS